MLSHNERRIWLLVGSLTAVTFFWSAGLAWADDGEGGGSTTRRAPKQVEKDKTTETEADKGESGEGEGGEKGDGSGGGLPCGQMGGMTPFFIIIGVFLLMYIFMGSSRRKQQAKRRDMLANVKKGDKVTSIGGICGTVMDVREDELVVKIDDASNTRMRLARWAVRGIGEEGKVEKPGDKK
ncbi:MAG: preprotein translocase subunit YajC [Planctomycetota bacterium]|jgi:preprotein translocase subunit YajC